MFVGLGVGGWVNEGYGCWTGRLVNISFHCPDPQILWVDAVFKWGKDHCPNCPVNVQCQKRDLKFEFRKKTIGVAVEFLLPDLVLKLSNAFCVLLNLHFEQCINDDRVKTIASYCFSAGWFWGLYIVKFTNNLTTYSRKPLKMQKCRFIAGLYTLMESPSSCSSPTIRDCSKFKYCPCPTGWSLKNAEVQTSVMTSRRFFSALVGLVSFFEGFNQSDQSICKTIDSIDFWMLGACFWMCEVWDFTTISQLFVR